MGERDAGDAACGLGLADLDLLGVRYLWGERCGVSDRRRKGFIHLNICSCIA